MSAPKLSVEIDGTVYIPLESERTTVIVLRCPPLWAQWQAVKMLFTGITLDRLKKLVDEGHVRRHKAGDSGPCSVCYSVEDLQRVYALEVSGKKLTRKRGRR